MEPWLFGVLIVAVGALGFVAQHFGWIDLSNKSKTSGSHGGVMGIGDEIFHPTRHEAQLELDRQTSMPAPAPVAGDGDKDVYKGNVTIDLSDSDRDRESDGDG